MDDVERQIHDAFTGAIELPQAEWPAYLDRTCAAPEVRRRVQTLLDAHARSGEFLSRPATETFPELADAVGPQVAEFRVVRQIGRGGMGVVYLAEDTVLKRPVALKVLPPQVDGRAAERFRREAQAVARLSHPGIVQVYRAGEERGFSYFAMEYVDGENLRSLLDAWPPRGPSGASNGVSARPPIPDLAQIVVDLADALEHAHQQGVIHRDVKPSNIILSRDGRARLTDFGVASIAAEQQGAADAAGTYGYMSPEQARAQATTVDERSDVFSLGVVLYELLAGRRPFEGSTPAEILKALTAGQPRQLHRVNSAVPDDLSTICHKAIETEPRNRYQRAAQLAADLRSFLAGNPILAARPGVRRLTRAWIKRHRAPVAAAAIGTLTVACGGLVWAQIAAHRASLGRLSLALAEDHETAIAFLARWSPDHRQLGAAERLGPLPIQGSRFSPGSYRITVVDDKDRFAETDVQLRPGATESRVVWCRPAPLQPDAMRRYDAAVPTAGTKTPSIALPAFWLDRTEVTNGQYFEFVSKTQHPAPEIWGQVPSFDAIARLPVVDVTRADMEAFANWAGKRLPTEQEWMAAAFDRRSAAVFPWELRPPPADLTPSCEMLLEGPGTTPEAMASNYLRFARPVDNCPSARSGAGLADVFGNVMEMTSTVLIDDRGTNAVVVGGYWLSDPRTFDLHRSSLFPFNGKSTQIGFRCARSVSPQTKTAPQ